MKEKGPRMARNRIVGAVAAAALVGGGGGAGVVAISNGGGSQSASSTTTTAALGGGTTTNVANAQLTIGEIAKQDSKSVVEIDATQSGSSGLGDSGSEAEGTGF